MACPARERLHTPAARFRRAFERPSCAGRRNTRPLMNDARNFTARGASDRDHSGTRSVRASIWHSGPQDTVCRSRFSVPWLNPYLVLLGRRRLTRDTDLGTSDGVLVALGFRPI